MCLALGRTLGELLPLMSAAEFAFWLAFYRRYGFPVDRLEVTVARVGSALSRAWGGRHDPEDFIPRYGPRQVSNKLLAAQLSALPGAKVERIERPERQAGRRPKAPDGNEDRPRSRVLNPRATGCQEHRAAGCQEHKRR